MKKNDEVQLLISELKSDMDFIEECYRKNRAMTERIIKNENADEFEYSSLGYTLHNLYNAFESYFLRIAKFFENNLESSGWHKSLVERMTLEIQGVRIALFDKDFALRLEELLKFRHVFRNIYKSPLIPEKILWINKAVCNISADFRIYHDRYCIFLKELAEKLEG